MYMIRLGPELDVFQGIPLENLEEEWVQKLYIVEALMLMKFIQYLFMEIMEQKCLLMKQKQMVALILGQQMMLQLIFLLNIIILLEQEHPFLV